MNKIVSFAISEYDCKRFLLLEEIALTTDETYLKLFQAMTLYMRGRRKLTREEKLQKAYWMGLDAEHIVD